MRKKDHFDVVFPYYSIDKNGNVRLRRISGSGIYRRKSRRINDWRQRNGISRSTGDQK